MKRYMVAAAGLLLGLGLLVAGLWGMGNTDRPTPETSAESAASREAGWVVGVCEGKLAVFPAGAAEPTRVYEVYIASLPREERERLAAGVIAADDTALASLLEDYTS